MYQISGSGWPDIRPFKKNLIPSLVLAKIVPDTRYLSWIAISPFWQFVHP